MSSEILSRSDSGPRIRDYFVVVVDPATCIGLPGTEVGSSDLSVCAATGWFSETNGDLLRRGVIFGNADVGHSRVYMSHPLGPHLQLVELVQLVPWIHVLCVRHNCPSHC